MSDSATLPAPLARARRFTLAAIAALLLLVFLRTGLSLPMASLAGITAWTIQALPLLALLPGLRRGRPRSYAWLGFVIQLYFIHGVILAFAPARLAWGLAQILLSALIFAGLISFIRRWRAEYPGPV
ncbi:MAG: DUF2069 domain-containing protein [Gammaproteobacteria bacterium]|nr:DUF2069 domain-containing protein [Gammaproteobacteria bacterium]